MIAYIIWLGLFALIFYYRYVRPMNFWKNRNVPQGKPTWFFGHNTEFILRRKSPPEHSQDIYNQCPDKRYMGIYEFTKPKLLLRDPELIKQVTVKDFDYFADRPIFIPPDIEPIWARNLFALNGHKWRDMRSILSPSFTSSKMKMMFSLIRDCSENVTNHFLKINRNVFQVGMKDVFTRFGNDVIATTAFGIHVDSLKDPNNKFYKMGGKLTSFEGLFIIIRFILTSFLPFLRKVLGKTIFNKEAMNFFFNIIEETIKTREEKKIVRPDMIHQLLEARKGNIQNEEKNVIDTGFATVNETITNTDFLRQPKDLSNLDIAAQALVFFFAGFDSVSSLLVFMGYELAVNPTIQNRLREEIFETQKACKGNLTYEALMEMKYLDMVVSESLRKWPNMYVLTRMCSKPYTIQSVLPGETPVFIEKGTTVLIYPFAMQRDPKYYPEPEKFDPERFSDKNKENINPYTYLPFGSGPRNCIGSRMALLEAKTIFYYILLNFEIVPREKTSIPPKLERNSVKFAVEDDIYLGFKHIIK